MLLTSAPLKRNQGKQKGQGWQKQQRIFAFLALFVFFAFPILALYSPALSV
jgi:hypothetical protein